jgi:hypothetical protein
MAAELAGAQEQIRSAETGMEQLQQLCDELRARQAEEESQLQRVGSCAVKKGMNEGAMPPSACAIMLVRLQLSKDLSLLSPCPSRPGMAAGEGRLAGAHVCAAVAWGR